MESPQTDIPKKPIATEIPLERAIDLYKFYEETAGKIKDRVWTLTTWILTLNTGIMGFCLQLYTQGRELLEFIVFEGLAGGAGIILCLFLRRLIEDQQKHLSNAWARSNRVTDQCLQVKAIAMIKKDEPGKSKTQAENDEECTADASRFCRKLLVFTNIFIVAFVLLFFILIGARINSLLAF